MLFQIQELKNTVNEKIQELDDIEMRLTSLAPESANVDDVRNNLITLHQEVDELFSKKLGQQADVDSYRKLIQDLCSWCEQMVKKSNKTDRGCGLSTDQRLEILGGIVAEIKNGKMMLNEIRTKVRF